MARSVAPNGMVYGQNPPDASEKMKTAFEARMKTPAMKDATADIRPFDDPIPPGVQNLDLITFLFFYHDTTYMKVDRAEMDRKMFAALKPGGFLVIADHSALPGAGHLGRQDAASHRGGDAAQGSRGGRFQGRRRGRFLAQPRRHPRLLTYKPVMPVDNFVLKFQKPM